ncbi:glucoamylase I precursor [Sphaerosporella brunnea]|uniref:glucan 1,4-alpha-glucosidase n=1 Tax=Sphaerosporella brunnea TaxID=1250544 RepID=A0A5J5ELM2_9PEZI|nr:glucoamylase I precursor [Sphaerosporella brunnea]
MHFFSSLLLAASIVASAHARALETRQSPSVSSWMSAEEPIARSSIFRNIGSSGEFAKDADAGAVIASPSTDSPNYYYQWVRDEAITFKYLLNQYINGNSSLEPLLKQYVSESDKLQRTTNPSGSYQGAGIGEPKFNVDGTAFTGSWGRPQTDGPAIRATVLTKFATMLLDAGETSYVTTYLYDGQLPSNSVIKNDLEYVSHYWTTNGFDLWEEVSGQHFFNYMVQQRALTEGAELATRLGDTGAATYYNQQAAAIKAALPNFWSSSYGYLISTIGTSRDGLDCGTLLGVLHGNGARGFGVYEASSDEALVTLQAMVNSMTPLYSINSASGSPGVAIGRYPADVYNGVGTSQGNPWFICTFTVAELLYTAINQFAAAGQITVTSTTLSFFQQFLSSVTAGTYSSNSNTYATIVAGLKNYADSFIAVGQLHAANNGSLSEEFQRSSGYMVGARDLTWSYGSFLTTKAARDGATAF